MDHQPQQKSKNTIRQIKKGRDSESEKKLNKLLGQQTEVKKYSKLGLITREELQSQKDPLKYYNERFAPIRMDAKTFYSKLISFPPTSINHNNTIEDLIIGSAQEKAFKNLIIKELLENENIFGVVVTDPGSLIDQHGSDFLTLTLKNNKKTNTNDFLVLV